MRLLYVLGQLSVKGGLERIIVDKANYLADVYGHDVWLLNVFQEESEGDVYRLSPAVNSVRLGLAYRPTTSWRQNPIRHFMEWQSWIRRCKDGVREFVLHNRPDVVLCTTCYDFGLEHHLSDTRLIVESHVSKYEDALNKGYDILHRWRRNRYKEKLMQSADVAVCLTKADAECWKGNVKVIPNFTDIAPKGTVDRSAKQAIAVGRISEQKGYDLLVRAWQKVAVSHSDWHLNIYGDGRTDDVTYLKSVIAQCSMATHVTLCGRVDDVAEAYASHSLFVFPSRWEGFGLVLLEAMTCGLPCVAFDCPYGPSDIIDDGEDGMLVPFDTSAEREGRGTELVDALAKSIIYMIEHPEVRERLGNAAIEKAKRFDKHKVMKMWNELLEDIVSK